MQKCPYKNCNYEGEEETFNLTHSKKYGRTGVCPKCEKKVTVTTWRGEKGGKRLTSSQRRRMRRANFQAIAEREVAKHENRDI